MPLWLPNSPDYEKGKEKWKIEEMFTELQLVWPAVNQESLDRLSKSFLRRCQMMLEWPEKASWRPFLTSIKTLMSHQNFKFQKDLFRIVREGTCSPREEHIQRNDQLVIPKRRPEDITFPLTIPPVHQSNRSHHLNGIHVIANKFLDAQA